MVYVKLGSQYEGDKTAATHCFKHNPSSLWRAGPNGYALLWQGRDSWLETDHENENLEDPLGWFMRLAPKKPV